MENRLLPPADVWADERLVVRGSPIEGRGLFFTDGLRVGDCGGSTRRRVVSSAELDALIRLADTDPAAPYVDTITVYDDAHLVLPLNTPIHVGNHSCHPTLWHVGPFELAASGPKTVDFGVDVVGTLLVDLDATPAGCLAEQFEQCVPFAESLRLARDKRWLDQGGVR